MGNNNNAMVRPLTKAEVKAAEVKKVKEQKAAAKAKADKAKAAEKAKADKAKAAEKAEKAAKAAAKAKAEKVAKEVGGKLAELIAKEIAAKKVAKAREEHHNICVEVDKFCKANKMPIGVAVYILVGKDAHRIPTFEKGYKKFNAEKGARIVKMAKCFSKHFGGINPYMDKLIHALDRYDNIYDNKGKYSFFKACVDSLPTEGFSYKNYKTATELAKFIFGENVSYDEKGRMI